MNQANTPLIERILQPAPGPFALLYRPESNGPGVLDVLSGTMSQPQRLADIELPATNIGEPRLDVLTLIPYRQIAERGFEAVDDQSPLLAMTITEQQSIGIEQLLGLLPDESIHLGSERFDLSDEAYAEIVSQVIANEIGSGEGANFVIKRTFLAEISEYGPAKALSFFRHLLEREKGAYWTFIIHTGDRTFVGASPERHISVKDGLAVMNPISGTYRYPPAGPNLAEVMEFLANRKEAEELYMVVDEELKMMALICEDGGHVRGPYLKEMAHLAHTEYFIEGKTRRDVRDILRETLFAPTVTGSPLESACRVIQRYEPQGRGYYSGMAALIGSDGKGGRSLDSSILIRTADIDDQGQVRISVGSTIVRHSDPLGEAAESRAKAAGLIAALKNQTPSRFGNHLQVRAALASRNAYVSDFWLMDSQQRQQVQGDFNGRQVLIVDAEDTFTSMIAKQLRALGLVVTVRSYNDAYRFDGYDLVIMGPGPGNPSEVEQPKINHLHLAIRTLLNEQRPFVAVCLSHQVLSLCLGLELQRRAIPNQGVQKQIDLFGNTERVGFYNTFAAQSGSDRLDIDGIGTVEISRDSETGEVHALRGPAFASMQFHAESLLTQEGPRIMADLLRHALIHTTAGSNTSVAGR
ncbi:anthranilate synthase family protein [Pseudomonas sessilinigenes]|uniref:anthranilate synthase family protein n=1 Tax=Pseudomonas sessilinigenes TaxID=658629 RepID=UPI000F58D126|nr:anthranilate synthase family protein [Pseudomonas sessilinigenes]AZC24771.1 2-Amino-2-deoxy-isochorismate synthase PhzE [Pseudomonas sessilinigenes]